MSELAHDIRRGLTDPTRVCSALGLLDRAQRQANGWLVKCPVHAEKTPSCSVSRGPDGTVRVKCFACGFAGDALTLVAAVHGLSTNGPDFREVLERSAVIGGMLWLAEEVRGGQAAARERPVRPAPEPPEPMPERSYPELAGLVTVPASEDPEVSGYLAFRRLCPLAASEKRLARVLATGTAQPDWASYKGQSWGSTGHRLILPVFDAAGRWRSVRACRVREGSSPKRLPPAGHRAAGLVLANQRAKAWLRGTDKAPGRVVFVEGEPDFLSWAQQFDGPVFGVLSGAWTVEHAARVPRGSEVLIRTHSDSAGEKYAEHISQTLNSKCEVWRCN